MMMVGIKMARLLMMMMYEEVVVVIMMIKSVNFLLVSNILSAT